MSSLKTRLAQGSNKFSKITNTILFAPAKVASEAMGLNGITTGSGGFGNGVIKGTVYAANFLAVAVAYVPIKVVQWTFDASTGISELKRELAIEEIRKKHGLLPKTGSTESE
jgi:hypothetical protein